MVVDSRHQHTTCTCKRGRLVFRFSSRHIYRLALVATSPLRRDDEGDDNGNGYDNDAPSDMGMCKTCKKVQVKQQKFEAEASPTTDITLSSDCTL